MSKLYEFNVTMYGWGDSVEEACPINYDRETVEVEFVIDKVII